MMKKAVSLILICLFMLGFGFSVLADNANEAMYGGYDDDFFADDYDDINDSPKTKTHPQQIWYKRLSFAPVAIGVLFGAAVVAILYRRSLGTVPEAVPYELNAKVSVAEEVDRPGRVTHTNRRLTPPHN